MRRRVQDVFAVRQEVAARGRPSPFEMRFYVLAIGIHDVDLVALGAVARGLKHQLLAVGRPVGFGVLSSGRELPQVRDSLRFLSNIQANRPKATTARAVMPLMIPPRKAPFRTKSKKLLTTTWSEAILIRPEE